MTKCPYAISCLCLDSQIASPICTRCCCYLCSNNRALMLPTPMREPSRAPCKASLGRVNAAKFDGALVRLSKRATPLPRACTICARLYGSFILRERSSSTAWSWSSNKYNAYCPEPCIDSRHVTSRTVTVYLASKAWQRDGER